MRSTHRYGALVALVLVTTVVVGCGRDDSSSTEVPVPVRPPSAEAQAGDAALGVYAEYWRLAAAALADPGGGRDWEAELEAVARGQALEMLLVDVENYAELPAHTVGDVLRSPAVDTASAGRVAIVDCVDLDDSRLVHDVTGETLDDLENRVQRYRFRAEVVREADGRWLVERTAPALDEPC